MTEQMQISCVKTPYKGIETSVFLFRTEQGALLFDAASYDHDIRDTVLPWLTEQGITPEELKYIFISHKHDDHAGGLPELLRHFPEAVILSQSRALQKQYEDRPFRLPADGETVLGCLQVISIPGHTADSAGILDTRTQTLVCGDCLQLYGIFGEGKWGANVTYPTAHREAIARLRGMPLRRILTAHEYHPCGSCYEGQKEISAALDACLAPLAYIETLIKANPSLTDEEICALYHQQGTVPTLGARVVAAMRKSMQDNIF